MRIAVISNYAESLLTFRRKLLEKLVDGGHHVMVSAPDFDDRQRRLLTELGVVCFPTTLKRTSVNPLEDLAYLWRLRALLRAIKPDLMLAYTMKPVIYGSFAARLAGVRQRFGMIAGLGYTFGNASRRQQVLSSVVGQLCKMAFAANEKIFVQNPDDAAFFIERRLLPADKLVVVNGSGIPLDDFSKAPLPPGPPVFLLIARLLVEKGILQFVEAARQLKNRYPDARFQIVGPFDSNPSSIQQDQLQAWVDQGWIEYLGETEDVRPYIRGCHVFVLPSYYREGTPRSVLEAMAMGRAVVTTDAPGCRETVIDGRNGFLVPPKNPESLAEAMARFIDDPGLLVSAGRESRRLAEEKYDVRKINQAMLSAMGLSADSEAPVAAPSQPAVVTSCTTRPASATTPL